MKRIFVSSVQKEFEKDRLAIKRMVECDPIIKAYYETFVFEIDAPAADKSTQEVYLNELGRSDVYLLLIGDKYGFEDSEGVSPTEREYDRAVELGLPIVVLVRGTDNSKREEKECRFLDKVSFGRTRVRYQSTDDAGDLLNEVRSSIREFMMDDGLLSDLPFEDQLPRDTTLDDIDDKRVAWFVHRAVRLRNAPFADDEAKEDVLRSLKLLDRKTGLPTKAAVLLFGKDPQYLFPTSCIKCISFFGTEKRKPSEDLALYEGDLFQLSDQAVAFINRHTFHGAGQHNHGSAADDIDEIPNSVITEAVNNAIAHRNYANNGSIQVEVYQDRIEVISPGRLMPPLTVESLYGKHESVAPNPHIARAMFWVKYIETVGTGLNELMDACAKAGLKRPTIEANDIHLRLIIWRREVVARPDKLPDKLPDKSPINASTKDRALAYIRTHPGCSRQQIAEFMGLSVESVKLALAALREGSAKIEHRGSNKTGGYYAKELEIGK